MIIFARFGNFSKHQFILTTTLFTFPVNPSGHSKDNTHDSKNYQETNTFDNEISTNQNMNKNMPD